MNLTLNVLQSVIITYIVGQSSQKYDGLFYLINPTKADSLCFEIYTTHLQSTENPQVLSVTVSLTLQAVS